jgi:hypothetical protein
MARINKYTEGVFTDIVGDQNSIPSYDRFLNVQNDLNPPTGELKKISERYRKQIIKQKVGFEKLAKMEELIMQLRTRDNLKSGDIKLNILREYVYARIPFYRTDKDTKDVRVLIDSYEMFGNDIDSLYGSKELMLLSMEKLKLAMDKVINENLNNLKKTS